MSGKWSNPIELPSPTYHGDIDSALSEYNLCYSEAHQLIQIPKITEFKSLQEALSIFITLSKSLTSKLVEVLQYPSPSEFHSESAELKKILSDQVTHT